MQATADPLAEARGRAEGEVTVTLRQLNRRSHLRGCHRIEQAARQQARS